MQSDVILITGLFSNEWDALKSDVIQIWRAFEFSYGVFLLNLFAYIRHRTKTDVDEWSF